MCGVIGVAAAHPVQGEIYDALTVLQHRGQDAAGISVLDSNRIHLRKGLGLVRDVFRQHHMERLQGCIGIGHVRYPTEGGMMVSEAQPMYVSVPCGMCLAHNGNLVNAADLAARLQREYFRDLSTNSDSEILLNMLAHYLRVQLDPANRLASVNQAVFTAVREVMQTCRGAYAVIALIKGIGLLAFRDPMGIRPLCIGQRSERGSVSYMVASESAALQALDFDLMRDVAPGEAVLIPVQGDSIGEPEFSSVLTGAGHSPCIFEWVYLSRPDSILDGASVYETRRNMGAALARRILSQMPHLAREVEAIVPVPECSTTCASQMAAEMRIPYREAFVKNRYIGRTFIMPIQEQRRRSVRQKLNPLAAEFRNKCVLLVDDSIVRGTTSGELVSLARRMGARKVYFASAAPPVCHPNVFGIDMPSRTELIAHGRSEQEICREIGADALVFQSLEDLEDSVRQAAPGLKDFETSIFTGRYPMGEISEGYLRDLAARRNDTARQELLRFPDLQGQEISGVF